MQVSATYYFTLFYMCRRLKDWLKWRVCEPLEAEVDEAERNGANEDTKHDSDDYCHHESFNKHEWIQLITATYLHTYLLTRPGVQDWTLQEWTFY